MDATKRLATKTYRHFMHDSLYRNSIYLMANNFSLAFVGFIFWIIAAHLYTPSQVGLTTTLISVTSVIILFSYLGLNNAFVRFLPTEKKPKQLMDSGLTLVSLAAAIVTIIFVIELRIFIPHLIVIHNNPWLALAFIIFMVLASLNSIIDSVFLANRSTKYTFYANFGYNISKLLLPFILIGLGNPGLFLAYTIGVAISLLHKFWFLAKRFNYIPKPHIDTKKIKKVAKFSFGNYIANFMVSSPAMLLPVIVTNRLGTKESAFFYMAITIAGLIYVIPNMITNSMFAESAHNEENLRYHTIRSIKLILSVVIPMCVIAFVLSRYVLEIFGQAYSINGTELLRIFIISAIFVSLNYIGATILNIRMRVKTLVLITIAGAVTIICLAYVMVTHSLNDVAWSWFIGQGIMSLLFLAYIIKTIFTIPGHKTT